jgi:hypothetical protein
VTLATDRNSAPAYCQYADGACDQVIPLAPTSGTAFFAYPSEPPTIAYTIESAITKLRARVPAIEWNSWKNLHTAGMTIFCEICKGMRASTTIIADVTTLNFNLLFEIGFAVGLGLPVIPIRDTSYIADTRLFSALGALDSLGYEDFTNSDDLANNLPQRLPGDVQSDPPTRLYNETPLYVLKGPINTEGVVQLMSTLKKSRIRFRTHDPQETARLSFNAAKRQVLGSVGVIANLLPPERGDHATTHNALCALVCGYAMAKQKVVLMLQEGEAVQPLDYRDVIQSYIHAGQIPRLLQPGLNRILDFIQTGSFSPVEVGNLGVLKNLDLGDVAAENEIYGLESYFVTTGQTIQARQGHARLVVGRKGSGKTAIFYEVRAAEGRGHERLMLDLRPEGPQFTRLREFLSSRMSPGTQEHTLVAFWTYILLTEIARKILEGHRTFAQRDDRRFHRYLELQALYGEHDPGRDADFSQRLMRQVARITAEVERTPGGSEAPSLTEAMYLGDIRELTDRITDYLQEFESVWLLIDNLDKGWPVRADASEDLLIIRSLLDATRKLQYLIEEQGIEFRCLVFLRSDIHSYLVRGIADKGKDTAIIVDWEDPAVFETLVARRISASLGVFGSFEELWHQVCVPLVGTQSSFSYIVERTLMRPRDLLQFLHRALDVAINRGHSRIQEEDILYAERGYSLDMLLATAYEISDTNAGLDDVLFAFQGVSAVMSEEDALLQLMDSGVESEARGREILELLIWYGFLGVQSPVFGAVRYSYDHEGGLRQLLVQVERKKASLVIHPAFRAALETNENGAQRLF